VETLRILIADDEAIIRMDLREMLSEMGHEVVGEAGDGEQAVSLARSLDPDLVFLDIKMPRMDGLEALRRMNCEAVRPVVVLTAFSEPMVVEEAVELGAKAYLVKPFAPANLLPAIHVAMAHSAELHTLRSENETLKETVRASRLVNRAKALLAEHEGVSEGEAFRRIQKLSMDKNRKMSEIAEAVIGLLATTRSS
jgi:AmiR/NasT family two-component response regulator